LIELKTPNTNYGMSGVENRTRPITKNINSILEDIHKLKVNNVAGIIAFVLFPVRSGDDQWKVYLERIKSVSDGVRDEDIYFTRRQIILKGNDSVEAIAVTIRI
jgi:hypothetical protein